MPHRRPLDGYRVVDFSSIVAGPWCTRLLADCGAEVIKVEPLGMGDVLRLAPPIADGQSRVYAHFNAGKKSVCLDLKSSDGVDVARELIGHADILVENFRPGVMARLGLDYESVAAAHPELIYCSVSGFGQTGPLAENAAYAPVVHALSGFDHVMLNAQRDKTVPLNAGIMIADVVAASYAFGAIQTAVIRRERFREGSRIDVTLIESMLSLVAIQCQEAQWDSEIPSTVFRPVETLDGHVMIPLVSYRNYLDLCDVIGRSDWRAEERFSSYERLLANRAEILTALAEWARDRHLEEVMDAMLAAGLPCARYQTPGEVLRNAHLEARGTFAPMVDAVGSFVVLNPPFRFDGAACSAAPLVARPGQHTDQVLAELLAIDEANIGRLRHIGAVA